MRRITFLPLPALAFALGLSATPASAPAQQDRGAPAASATSCARLIAPLERRLKEAVPRLERAGDAKTRENVRSRLLFDLLSGEDAQKAIAQALACLAADRR